MAASVSHANRRPSITIFPFTMTVSTSADEYRPRRLGPLPQLADAGRIQELIRKLEDGESVPDNERRLLAPGVTMGGARPKALLDAQDYAGIEANVKRCIAMIRQIRGK